MSLTREQFMAVVSAMEAMTERQQDYYIRLCERLLADPEFGARLDREGVIFQTLLASENYAALDRWFSRGRLRLVINNDAGGAK